MRVLSGAPPTDILDRISYPSTTNKGGRRQQPLTEKASGKGYSTYLISVHDVLQQVSQPVGVLRTHDEIDLRDPPEKLLALLLSDTPGIPGGPRVATQEELGEKNVVLCLSLCLLSLLAIAFHTNGAEVRHTPITISRVFS